MTFIHAKFKLKRENFGSRHCLTKCTLESIVWTKIGDLSIIFLRRSYLIRWYQLLHPHIMGSMPFRFFWATLYTWAPICERSTNNIIQVIIRLGSYCASCMHFVGFPQEGTYSGIDLRPFQFRKTVTWIEMIITPQIMAYTCIWQFSFCIHKNIQVFIWKRLQSQFSLITGEKLRKNL